MDDISLIAVVKNEEEQLFKMLSSVSFMTKEIIIVDNNSTDSTIDICKEFKAKVYNYDFKWHDNLFIDAKNLALSKCNCEWVICLDADEELSDELSQEFILFSRQREFDALKVRRLNFLRNYRATADSIVKLFRRKAGYGFFMHHHLPHEAPALDSQGHLGKVKRTKNALYHYGWTFLSKKALKLKIERYNNFGIPEVLK